MTNPAIPFVELGGEKLPKGTPRDRAILTETLFRRMRKRQALESLRLMQADNEKTFNELDAIDQMQLSDGDFVRLVNTLSGRYEVLDYMADKVKGEGKGREWVEGLNLDTNQVMATLVELFGLVVSTPDETEMGAAEADGAQRPSEPASSPR